MNSLTDFTVVNAGVALLFSIAIYYYFFMFGKTTPTVKVEAKSREIKKTSEPTMSVTKKAENEKKKEIKKTDPSVVKVTSSYLFFPFETVLPDYYYFVIGCTK
ncbi:hypothetical protein BDF21DRAFT_91209 [Thamnidium elegans]|nr:hypothetical protein BDF21DRAFT_91209 [Thamnidium elegans]